jgi:hypothetical protein
VSARHKDWRARLSASIETKRRMPFAFGQNDCALFVADSIEAVIGVDLAAPYRGRYASAEEALQLMRAAGYADLCALVAGHLDEIPPAFARAGDVMAFPSDETGWAIGVVNGERVTVLRPDGLGTLPRDKAARAFRCP